MGTLEPRKSSSGDSKRHSSDGVCENASGETESRDVDFGVMALIPAEH